MKYVSTALGMALAAVAVSVAQAVYYYPLLPDRVASHFGPDGRADGWMDKGAFVAFNIFLVVFVAALTSETAALIARLPDSTINLPNKDYWLAPERRERTLAAIADQMHWMSAATSVLLVAILQGVYQANLLPEPRLQGPFAAILFAYLGFVAVWLIGLFRRFRLPSR